MISDYFSIALKNLKNRKLRSYLTIVGIVIGVTAIISLILLGEGLENSLTKQFDKFGTRRIFVGPKIVSSFTGPPAGKGIITTDDMDTLKKLSFVEYIIPMYSSSGKVEYKRQSFNRDIFGMGVDNIEKSFQDLDIKLEEGRFIKEGDKYSVVIGYKIAFDLFDHDIHEKNSIKIDDVKFRVVGIQEYQGTQNEDYQIFMPIDTLREIKNSPDAISGITAQIKPGIGIESAVERIERELERKRDDENFQVTSPAKIKEQTETVLALVKWVVVSIALIALIVGSIGIMNSMYTSVLERTREIGVMKAIGAKNISILVMFLIEAGFLGLVGGLIGIILGAGLSFGMVAAINQFGVFDIVMEMNYNLLFFGLFFAFFLGMASGALPASRASKLKPVDALRYE